MKNTLFEAQSRSGVPSAFWAIVLFTAAFIGTELALAKQKTLQPPPDEAEDVSNAYRDMIVVQRKAKEKAGKFLTSTHVSSEFSDGPFYTYSFNLNFGYAFSDQFEAYVNVAPYYLVQDRNIKSQVSGLTLADGRKATLVAAEPKTHYGLELLWAPAYGKDSWGPFRIVRSDTFFKFYAGMVQYDIGTGPRYGLGVGKTFFIDPLFNLRVSANFVLQESILNDKRYLANAGVFDIGCIWYF